MLKNPKVPKNTIKTRRDVSFGCISVPKKI
jgi:hypothetical protein